MSKCTHPPLPGSGVRETCERRTGESVRPQAAQEGQVTSGQEEPPPNGTWIPDPMLLAVLAAQLHPQDCRTSSPEQALQHAWALFVQSKTFCIELQQKSLTELSHLYGTTPGCSHTSRVLRKFQACALPPKTLRFYPNGAMVDGVSKFLGAKSPRAVFTRIKKYCDSNGDEDGNSTYDTILEEAEKIGENGELYYELPVELLCEIKKREKQVKHDGGKRSRRSPSRLLREVVPDA